MLRPLAKPAGLSQFQQGRSPKPEGSLEPGANEPFHPQFTSVAPGKFHVQEITHPCSRIHLIKLMKMRKFAKRPMNELLPKTIRRLVNRMLESQDHRQNSGDGDFKPCSASGMQATVVMEHAKSRPSAMQQHKMLRVFVKSENGSPWQFNYLFKLEMQLR